jgi:alginate O-acetyltransferase complex protein AlgI
VLFTEPSFLFVFLPLVLLLYFGAPKSARNTVLTLASLAFYTLGEWRFLPFLVGSVAINYVFAIWIEQTRARPHAKWVLALGIFSDLALLLVFKYAGWFAVNLNSVLAIAHFSSVPVPHLLLPLGISFFTFHKISYKVDVYRGTTPAQRNVMTLALYILLFPQLIAGPIIRYHEVSDQLERRQVHAAEFASGVRRFILGLAKKMLVANSAAVVADNVFSLPHDVLGMGNAWVGVTAYTLQIYFDFSGYSDMAVGLGRMFGFRFPENFEHPYAARSITDFWRRWHMSLSRWFRDYLYIPLGGNRGTASATYRNLVLVFFLCGLWHGASWAFVVWGLFHGLFLVIERLRVGAWLDRAPRVVTHLYAIVVVMIGWVFFRANTFDDALAILGAMTGLTGGTAEPVRSFVDPWSLTWLLVGIVMAFPVRRWISQRWDVKAFEPLPTIGLFCLFFASFTLAAAGTYNPFLYFRF